MVVRTLQVGALSDGELLARSGSSRDAFHGLFGRHFKVVHWYLARRVGRDRADDLASQTFTIAFRRRETFRSDASDARPWLLGIAANLLMNERRAEQRSLQTVDRIQAQPLPTAGPRQPGRTSSTSATSFERPTPGQHCAQRSTERPH
jgi:DNA-directed RNA polymerase specialized sigma24 family protein